MATKIKAHNLHTDVKAILDSKADISALAGKADSDTVVAALANFSGGVCLPCPLRRPSFPAPIHYFRTWGGQHGAMSDDSGHYGSSGH